jgi:hypothetical protein
MMAQRTQVESSPRGFTLYVSDARGRRAVGHATRWRREGPWVARDRDGNWCGEFHTRKAALQALAILGGVRDRALIDA